MLRNLRILALFTLLATPAVAHENPVLIQLEAQEVRFETVFERFQISIRGIIQSQGGVYDPSLMPQFYAFLPQYLEQRASEIVLLEAARQRGVVVDEEALDARIAALVVRFPGEAAFLLAVESAGFRDLDQFRELLAEEQLIEGLYRQLEGDVEVLEADLEAAYLEIAAQLIEPATACASHILVTDQADATALLAELRSGADFASLAANNSIDTSSAIQGGSLGCFPRGMMVGPFEQAAFDAELGVPTEPVQTQFGWHIVLVESREPDRTLSLDEVREPLQRELVRERVDALIGALIAASGVLTFPEAIPDYSQVETKTP
jgi:parvulin-like peptidyl-prolyl isomerase